MIKRGQKRKETALNDRNLPLKTSSSQSFCPLRVFGENSQQCNLTGRLQNVEMRRTDTQYAKSLISFQNSYSLSMLTSSNYAHATFSYVKNAMQLGRSATYVNIFLGKSTNITKIQKNVTFACHSLAPFVLGPLEVSGCQLGA